MFNLLVSKNINTRLTEIDDAILHITGYQKYIFSSIKMCLIESIRDRICLSVIVIFFFIVTNNNRKVVRLR